MKKHILSFLLAVFYVGVYAQPANDLCLGAITIQQNGSCTNGTLTAANDNIINEDGCGTPGMNTQHRDVWYVFQATGPNFAYSITNGTLGANNVNITIYPYNVTCLGIATTHIGSDCGGSPVNGIMNGILTTNQFYFVVISSDANAQGTFTLCISNGPPPNDQCATATSVIANGSCVAGNNIGANDNITGEVGCATPGAAADHYDVWYSFVATDATFEYTLTAGTITGNMEIAIFGSTGACAGLTLLGSACGALPLSGTLSGSNSTLSSSLIVGNTYYVAISAPNQTQGTFTFCIDNGPQTGGGQNCVQSQQVCSNSTVSGNSNGFGIQELPNNNSVDGCLTVEHQSSWFIINISAPGNLTMAIAPNAGVDYDYALWGPASTCPPSTGPVRCSYASGANTNTATGAYTTGIGGPGTETSDGTTGTLDGWTAALPVTAGQTYILLIDNFTANATPFNLNWSGSAILNCTPLPVEFISFTGAMTEEGIELVWEVGSEINNDYFKVERRNNDNTFTTLATQNGRGNANSYLKYTFTDAAPANGENYYRITQVDLDGASTHTAVILVRFNPSGVTWSNVYPNPAEENINLEFQSVSKGEMEAEILDMTGRVLNTVGANAEKGSNKVTVNTASMGKGAYMVRLKKDGFFVDPYKLFVKN